MSDQPDRAATAAAEDAAFASGFTDKSPANAEKPPEKVEAKVEPKVEAKVEAKAPPLALPPVEKPEYVRITKKDWEAVHGQLSKAFGTIGSMQKTMNGLQERPTTGRKVEIPQSAFAEMEKDFPELAQQVRAAMEAGMSGMSGTGPAPEADTSRYDEARAKDRQEKVAEQMADLEDAHPTWRTIVGAIDARTQRPDPNNAFRRWLGTKDASYQKRLNDSESSTFISRAIERFQAETKGTRAAAPATSRDDARSDRIRDALQPRGDNAGAAAGPSDDDAFLEGFNSR